jgi:hypothetical protein
MFQASELYNRSASMQTIAAAAWLFPGRGATSPQRVQGCPVVERLSHFRQWGPMLLVTFRWAAVGIQLNERRRGTPSKVHGSGKVGTAYVVP